MDDPGSVMAFHQQGAQTGPLLPIYHFNAVATSRRVPAGGTVLDLGSGSGQYLAYLAACRPDIRVIGVDLSPTMIAIGREALRDAGLAGRVELIEGDMTDFVDLAPGRVDLVSTVFALHHLPSHEMLGRCLGEVARIRRRDGCGVWIFDHARPRHPATCDNFPTVFTPEAPALFNLDSSNSLRASHTFRELTKALSSAGVNGLRHHLARYIPLYQVHATDPDLTSEVNVAWRAEILPNRAAREFSQLMKIFPILR
jgi:SAM-dependent methyltransferase